MKRVKISKKILEKLENLGLKVTMYHSAGELQIGDVLFQPTSTVESFESLQENLGLILKDSTVELRRSLESKNINFLDTNGNLSISSGELNLKIQCTKSRQKKKKTSVHFDTSIPITHLVSPNGFAIIDAIFRLSDAELRNFPSALSFCKVMSLNQPKLSKMMTLFNVNKLLDLKRQIQKIPIDWWLYSFDQGLTKRKMLPFFETAQFYYSSDEKKEMLSNEQLLTTIKNEFDGHFCEGPTLVAQNFSELAENGFSVWISAVIANDFKRKFRLIPGRKENHKQWQIAVATTSLEKMELKSHVQDLNNIQLTSNVIRSIWDLSFSESRAREIRGNIIRKFFK